MCTSILVVELVHVFSDNQQGGLQLVAGETVGFLADGARRPRAVTRAPGVADRMLSNRESQAGTSRWVRILIRRGGGVGRASR